MIEDKISILKEVFPSFRVRKGFEYVTFCPSADCKKHNQFKIEPKKKLEINLKNDVFACWRCGYSGHPLKLLKNHGTSQLRARYAALCGLKQNTSDFDAPVDNLELPPEYKFIFDSDSSLAKRSREYLKNFEVANIVAYQHRIGFCPTGKYSNRMIFPSFDENGNLNYFISRHLFEDGSFKWLKCERSMKSVIFNEIFLDFTKPIVLVETVKSSLKHFEEIDNLAVCNGSFLSKDYLLFKKIILEDCPKVFVAFDGDARTKALETIENFNEFGINACLVDIKDKSQNISSYEFEECISNAKPVDKFSLLKDKINNLL